MGLENVMPAILPRRDATNLQPSAPVAVHPARFIKPTSARPGRAARTAETFSDCPVTQGVSDVTIVIPTRNESGNVEELVRRLTRALGARSAEIVFVDDSADDTPDRIRAVAAVSIVDVRLLHREPADRGGGLGSAVLAGLRLARSPWAVVMDGDLQHPPELVPTLLDAGSRAGADVVVASRYVADGDRSGLASRFRRWVSGSATRLAKITFPRRLRDCTDPMSGFFAVRLASLDLNHLQPNGFKILLEILAGTPSLKVVERPFTFAARFSGESKANWREGLRYVLGLARLRMTVSHPALRRVMVVVSFGLVGVSGLVVNSAVLWALVAGWGAPILVGAALATQVSTVWTYLLTDLLVFHGKKTRPAWLRFAGFALLNNALLLARLPVLFWLVQGVGLAYVPANLVTLLAAFTIRFAASDHLLFTRRNAMTLLDTRRAKHASDGDTARTGPVDLLVDIRPEAAPVVRCREVELPWRYDIHGLVRIASVVRLTELDSFASIAPASADIEIRRGEIGDGRWRARTKVTQFAGVPAVSYQEHLGRFGSDFCVDMTGGTIQVNVGPMLVRSPHVLYTNVVEALLRFVLVARDHMLLHSACLDLGGRGVLLSALTDTGKTGTVLRLLRENDARFLSDDMTVLCPDGTALAYPKPMTISQHTLRAVNVGDLSRREWRKLRLQSRLHSKEGRSIGSRLGSMNLPIMTLNALTQWVVPPPKYEVERLVPCRQARSVRIDELFVIARGDLGLSEIAAGDDLVDELLANTDDAYGFPPFRYFAPALVVGGLAYEELRARERNILAAAISGIRAHRLVTPDFSWADRIPDVVRSGDAAMSGEEDPPTTAVPVDLLPTPRREWLAASGSTSAPVSSPSEPAAF